MGFGDDVQASGEAQRLYEANPVKVAITHLNGAVRWSEMWDRNPVIATPEEVAAGVPVQFLVNGVNCRPYNANRPFTRAGGIKFTDWRARDNRGRIYLTDAELEVGRFVRRRFGPYWLVEPSPITISNPNKQWPYERFGEVVKRVRDRIWVQGVHPDSRPLDGIVRVRTSTFRTACGLLSGASGYLGTEGGLHHAAAALGIPAVIIFGGCMSVETFGYPEHVNLVDDSTETPCGRWSPCEHCREAMSQISVDRVVAGVQEACRGC